MTEEINLKITSKIYTDSSILLLKSIYDEFVLVLDKLSASEALDGLYRDWLGKIGELKLRNLTIKSEDESILGMVTTENGMNENAKLTIKETQKDDERINYLEKNVLNGLKAYGAYDIEFSNLADETNYIVTLKLPSNVKLAKNFKVVCLNKAGEYDILDAKIKDGYITFVFNNLSEVYIMGEPPVNILYMTIPVGIIITLFVLFIYFSIKASKEKNSNE